MPLVKPYCTLQEAIDELSRLEPSLPREQILDHLFDHIEQRELNAWLYDERTKTTFEVDPSWWRSTYSRDGGRDTTREFQFNVEYGMGTLIDSDGELVGGQIRVDRAGLEKAVQRSAAASSASETQDDQAAGSATTVKRTPTQKEFDLWLRRQRYNDPKMNRPKAFNAAKEHFGSHLSGREFDFLWKGSTIRGLHKPGRKPTRANP